MADHLYGAGIERPAASIVPPALAFEKDVNECLRLLAAAHDAVTAAEGAVMRQEEVLEASKLAHKVTIEKEENSTSFRDDGVKLLAGAKQLVWPLRGTCNHSPNWLQKVSQKSESWKMQKCKMKF